LPLLAGTIARLEVFTEGISWVHGSPWILAMLFAMVNSPAYCPIHSAANNGRMSTHRKTKTTPPANRTRGEIPASTMEQEAAALKTAFEQLTQETGISQERFGLEHDIGSQGMVWQYLNAHRPLNLRVALKFARGLGVPLSHFSPRLAAELEELGASSTNVDAPNTLKILKASRIPVTGVVRESSPPYVHVEPPTVAGFVSYPTKRGNAYALLVHGDFARPRVKPGEYLVIEPSIECQPGDEVFVRTRGGRCLIKVLHARRATFVELLPLNDEHKTISIDLSDIESMHYIAGIAKQVLYATDQEDPNGVN
jgi:SOS-response transcriptional repressor LexA